MTVQSHEHLWVDFDFPREDGSVTQFCPRCLEKREKESAHARNRSRIEWAVLDELRQHLYDTRTRGGKPDDPGWHPCSCGWEGYWVDWQPHVAEKIVEALNG